VKGSELFPKKLHAVIDILALATLLMFIKYMDGTYAYVDEFISMDPRRM
jgi:hypothetical protein